MQDKKEYMTNEQSAFPHFLIRFTRAIQRNEKGWDALFLYALAVAPLRVIDSVECRAFARNEANRRFNGVNLGLGFELFSCSVVASRHCEERSNLEV